jgi:hypothetical protein
VCASSRSRVGGSEKVGVVGATTTRRKARGVLVIPRFQPLDIADHLLEAFRLQRRFREARVRAGGFQRTTATQHKAQPELIGQIKQ